MMVILLQLPKSSPDKLSFPAASLWLYSCALPCLIRNGALVQGFLLRLPYDEAVDGCPVP